MLFYKHLPVLLLALVLIYLNTTPMAAAVRSCVIIGGGAAGMSAGVTLVRTRRLVTIIDAGQQSNRAAQEAHNFFTRDGEAPSSLYTVSHEQFKQYPSGQILNTQVTDVAKNEKGNFLVKTASGEEVETRTILLAQGMSYIVPNIPGLKEGTKAFHCPFCHGYEVSDKRILIILKSMEKLGHLAAIIRSWSRKVMFSVANITDVEEETRKRVEKFAKFVAPVKKVIDGDVIRVETENGEVECDSIMVECDIDQRDDIVTKLGVEKQGYFVKVDEFGRTNVKGVYCAGDQQNPRAQIALAVGSGSLAGVSVHMDLSLEEIDE